MLQGDRCVGVPFLDQIRVSNRFKDFLLLARHFGVAVIDMGHPLRCQSYRKP